MLFVLIRHTKKNKEGKPFALFVGVNHHRQTIIFGAALLYDETTSTFTWLFDTFTRAMSGKQPKTILTDQDAAMAKALAIQWPETCHRLCIWHIYQNAATHLSNVFARFKNFSKDFSFCIYGYEEEDEFLNAWRRMLEKYELLDNEWLERLFKVREKWALVYGRNSFCANMTTTQRSESMNSVLKKYVSYKHNLLQFCQHFDRLVSDHRYEELKADYRTNHTIPVSAFRVQILKHATTVYTHEVLTLFEGELHKAYDATCDLCSQIGDALEYKVKLFGKNYQHTVAFIRPEKKVSCSCKKFEFAGILCSHVLKVFSLNNITEIPELYIKKRWTKKAKQNTVKDQPIEALEKPFESINEDEEKKLIGVHYKELCSLYNHLTTRGALTTKAFQIAKKYFLKGIEEVDACLENASFVRSTHRTKSIVQKNILSRVVDNRMSEVVLDEDEQAFDGVVIKGWKNKEKKPIKSGKRETRGLEKSGKRKRTKDAITLIEDHEQV